MSGEATRTCGWCSRPTMADVICPTCESLDRRAQPTGLHALPAGTWKRDKSGVYRYEPAEPPGVDTDDGGCVDCHRPCRGIRCRNCFYAATRGLNRKPRWDYPLEEARDAHAAYARGDRTNWALDGERAYQREQKRAKRQQREMAA